MTVALEGVEKPKVVGFVDSGYNRKNRARIEQDEKELEELLSGKVPEENEQEQEKVAEVKEEPKLTKEEESFKKRYGDLRRHMAEKEKEWEAKFEELKTQKPQSSIIPPKSDEDLEDWVKKYPDIAGIVSALVEKQMQGTKESVKELDNLRWETKKERAESEVRKAHNDWDEIKESDDFHDWLDEQPKAIQDALFEQIDDSKSVIRVIDFYKADKGLTKQAQKEDARKAAGFVKPTTKAAVDKDEGGFMFSESQVAKMSDKEYEKNEAKILEAMRSGKFNYDMSGGAR